MDHFQFYKQLQSNPSALTEQQWTAARASALQAMGRRRNKIAKRLDRLTELDRSFWMMPMGAVSAAVFVLLIALPKSVLTYDQACLAGVLATVVWASVLMLFEHKFNQIRHVLELTQPISEIESDICEEALRLCRESAQASAVRDGVVAAGMELRVFHFLEMRKFHAADLELATKAAEAERRRLACRELHGVPQ